MLNECIEGLNIKKNGIYVDGTLGGAGHSKEILKRLSSKGMLIGIDRDEEALKAAKENLRQYSNVKYVHGNHDEIYESDPPLGCVCVEDRIVVYKGIRIMGLGGSIDYNGGKFQYTQKEMNRRCRKLWFALKKHSGIDILVTHAPAFKMNDGIDYPHQGFQAFQKIIDYWHPRFFVHGHIHLNYGHDMNRVSQYKSTVIVNAYDHYVIEW